MQNYNCKNCGAMLYWDTDANCLKCQYCGSSYEPSEFEDQTIQSDTATNESEKEGELKAESFEEESQEDGGQSNEEDMSLYHCKTCGGEVITLKTTMATICPYCGEAISITSKSVGKFRPKKCIPFRINKREIVQKYKEYVSSSKYTPQKFKEDSVIEKIQGLFVPYYLNSMTLDVENRFQGEITTRTTTTNEIITTHKLYDLILRAKGTFENIPTDASKKLDNEMMDSLEPFPYEKCKEYNPAYMAGFLAEQADVEQTESEERSKARAMESMATKARSTFSRYTLTSPRTNAETMQYSSEYVMLPVWLLNVDYHGQKYQFAINGETGKIVGKTPMDKKKLAINGAIRFLLCDILLAIAAVIFL